jgi:hypothetical protein
MNRSIRHLDGAPRPSDRRARMGLLTVVIVSVMSIGGALLFGCGPGAGRSSGEAERLHGQDGWTGDADLFPADLSDRAREVRSLDLEAARALAAHAQAVDGAGGAASDTVDRAARALEDVEDRLSEALRAWVQEGAETCSHAHELVDRFHEVATFTAVHFRRVTGLLATELPDLAQAPHCAGDAVVDGLLYRYLDAVVRGQAQAAAEALRRFDQQLMCMSVRQAQAAAVGLAFALEYTRRSYEFTGRTCDVAALDALDQAAFNLVYRSFERTLPYARASLEWMDGRRGAFLAALVDPTSVLSQQRLWVSTAASPETLVRIPADCPTNGPLQDRRYAGPTQEATCDPLAAFVRSLGPLNFGVGNCLGGDLEPHGGEALVSELACQRSCDALAGLEDGGSTAGSEPEVAAALLRTDETPLGASTADVRRQCDGFPEGVGGGFVGNGGVADRDTGLACGMGIESTAPSGHGGHELITCMARGLTSGAGPQMGGGSLRSCAGDLAGQNGPEEGGEPAGEPEGGAAEPPAEGPSGGEEEEASPEPATTPGTSGSSGSGGSATREVERIVRDIVTRGETTIVVDGRPITIDFSLQKQPNPAVGPIPYSPAEFHFRVTVPFYCTLDGECPGGCTGFDRFSQAFDECRKSLAPAPSPGTLDPGPGGHPGSPDASCFEGSDPPSLARDLHDCFAVLCPADQNAVSAHGGMCYCGGAVGGSDPGFSQEDLLCSRVRCPPGTVVVIGGAGCTCQRTGGGLDSGGISPTFEAPRILDGAPILERSPMLEGSPTFERIPIREGLPIREGP